MKEVIFNQFFGIGDILFIEPIMRRYFHAGYLVVLPILEKYYDIGRHFPYVNLIKKNDLDIDYEEQRIIDTPKRLILPMRWSREYFESPLHCTMMNKYKMLGIDPMEWKTLKYYRFREHEKTLLPEKPYNLINCNWHSFDNNRREISINNGLDNYYMSINPDYTLLDWSTVIENATTIHTVNTSLMFLLETLNLKAQEIHVYSRNSDGSDFKNTEYLFEKEYIRHK